MTAAADPDVTVPPARGVVLVRWAVLLVLGAAVVAVALLSGAPSPVGDGPAPAGVVDASRLGEAGPGRVGSPATPLDGDRKIPAPGGQGAAVGKMRAVPR